MRRVVRVMTLALTVSGCAYYNAMWSAERFAKDARRLEARGHESEARTQWARAAVKAESVMVHHPHSRWADDALVLRAEGLAHAGSCAAAAAPISKALATVSEASLRERAGLAAAQCALRTGKAGDADLALAEALASDDASRRSRAELLAGQGAASRFDYDAAIEHFARSREPKALPARARALLAVGRPAEAAAVLDTIALGRFDAQEWTELLDGLGAAGGEGIDAASAALDRLLARTRVPFADRARLLVADGDRRLARADFDGAVARYRQAAAAAPVGEAGVAHVRELRVMAARATGRSDLGPVVLELTRIARPGGREVIAGVGGSGAAQAQDLLDLVERMVVSPPSPGGAFRVAELARDSLGAPRLAGQLFLDLAATDSASLFAPKALVAALALLPERHDSIVAVLDRTYAASAYTRAWRGEASPAYAALEDSLARELGVQLVRGTFGAAARPTALRTGPRGPWLDDPPVIRAALPARGRERPNEPGRRVPIDRPPQDRPIVPPASL